MSLWLFLTPAFESMPTLLEGCSMDMTWLRILRDRMTGMAEILILPIQEIGVRQNLIPRAVGTAPMSQAQFPPLEIIILGAPG